MKKRFILFLFIFCFTRCGCALGANALIPKNINSLPELKTTLPPISAAPSPSPVKPQPIDFSNCNKYFKLNSQRLFYLTLASISANRFRIDEIQSKSGYVIFTAAQKQFLASVIVVDAQNSMLKITPCNNIYYFPIGIVQNIFKFVEINKFTPIEKLSIL